MQKQNQEKMTEQTYSTPFLGYPYYSNHDDLTVHPYHNDDCPPMRGMYRFHIPDPCLFPGRTLELRFSRLVCLITGYLNVQDDVSSVAYWYQEAGDVANDIVHCRRRKKDGRGRMIIKKNKLLTEPSKEWEIAKSISFKFRGAYVHEKTYGGGSAVAERVYISIYGLKPAP